MEKFACLCCGCLTLDERGIYDICPVCFWEDDAYLIFYEDKIEAVRVSYDVSDEDLLDIPSGANHGLTLRQGRENYRKFGACVEDMIPHVRKPKKSEIPNNTNRGKNER